VNVVPLSEEIAAEGWRLFCERPDKEWSWTDCISFAVMKEREITNALTSDQHFEQAGFTALIR
jgi:predicted nucleic acid-binding protein